MIKTRRTEERRERRIKRTRKKYTFKGRRRLVVYRSSKHIYAQLMDDLQGVCITGASSLSPEIRDKTKDLTKKETALLVGELVAKRAQDKGIDKVVFDRHGYRYQGRVKALAEGARKGGLKF